MSFLYTQIKHKRQLKWNVNWKKEINNPPFIHSHFLFVFYKLTSILFLRPNYEKLKFEGKFLKNLMIVRETKHFLQRQSWHLVIKVCTTREVVRDLFLKIPVFISLWNLKSQQLKLFIRIIILKVIKQQFSIYLDFKILCN